MKPSFCLQCRRPLLTKPRGRTRLWCSDNCRKRFEYFREYLASLAVMDRFDLVSHPMKDEATGDCLRCGLKLRRTGYRPRTYCSERCRSAFRRAKKAYQEQIRNAVASAIVVLANRQ
jgi:ribosomal protein L37AE/L43A